MFLKNKNIIFKIRRSKVTDYAALNKMLLIRNGIHKMQARITKREYPDQTASVRSKITIFKRIAVSVNTHQSIFLGK